MRSAASLLGVVLTMTTIALGVDPAAVRLHDDSIWCGAPGDLVEVICSDERREAVSIGELVAVGQEFLILEPDVAGDWSHEIIFRSGVDRMRTLRSGSAIRSDRSSAHPQDQNLRASDRDSAEAEKRDQPPGGVFVLPLRGFVGSEIRHLEILAVAEHADGWGPGQCIVLQIRTDGGMLIDADYVVQAIADVRRRHQVIAWVERAVSSGCRMAIGCDQMYYTTSGFLACAVMIKQGCPAGPRPDEAQRVREFVQLAADSGYSPILGRALRVYGTLCSYDKDSVTGVVQFYNDMSGEFVLSIENDYLSLNARDALHCGFSRGTADTLADLGTLLGMPQFYEIDSYGRDIAEDWSEVIREARDEVPPLLVRLNSGAGDCREAMIEHIEALVQLRAWVVRLGRAAWMLDLPAQPALIDDDINEMIRALPAA